MGLKDKAENKLQDLGGQGKEAAGRATDDHELEAEGRGDQAESKVKDAGEKAKDALGDVKDAFKK
ncbi:CsbD family protein [Nocardioides sp. SYSU D00038]|uniref:CsbD family protein n=1 Tax=Nocardioides sp. SYSU D00038 TaxID=2812554 RepID=UPI0019676334|nr:CsbD family protein [Nocardioides sp. SYSU D00038]